MKAQKGFFALPLAIAFCATIVWPDRSCAAEIKVLSLSGMSPVLAQLIPDFEKSTGHRVSAIYGTPMVMRQRLAKDDQFDVVFGMANIWPDLVRERKVETGSTLAQFGMSVGVRQGAPKPNVRDVPAFKKTLIDAQSIAVGDPGVGGPAAAVLKMFERLDIAEHLAPKLKKYPNGAAIAKAVASGEAELGLVITPDLVAAPGVEIAGPFPAELQLTLPVMSAVAVGTPNREAAQAFIEFVRRPTSASAFTSKGLDPRF